MSVITKLREIVRVFEIWLVHEEERKRLIETSNEEPDMDDIVGRMNTDEILLKIGISLGLSVYGGEG